MKTTNQHGTKIETYPIIRNKEYIRRATRVVFADGTTVRFFCEMTNKDALAEAIKVKANMMAETVCPE